MSTSSSSRSVNKNDNLKQAYQKYNKHKKNLNIVCRKCPFGKYYDIDYWHCEETDMLYNMNYYADPIETILFAVKNNMNEVTQLKLKEKCPKYRKLELLARLMLV